VAELEESQQQPKKKGMLKWIILLVVLLVLGGGGFFAYKQFFAGDSGQAPAQDQAAQQEGGEGSGAQGQAGDAGTEPQIVTLPTFLVNLADPLGRRYLKLTLDVEVRGPQAAEELTASEPKVRDAIILLLSSKSYADLSSLESKILLKKEIVERLNLLLGGPKVLRVYFTEMVIQ
jgi:flagellar FliL protein